MKATALFVAFLLVTVSYSVDLTNKISSLSMNSGHSTAKFKSLMNTPLGTLIAEMAELHTELGAPIDELVKAITDLYQDLQNQESAAQVKQNTAVSNHEANVKNINSEISAATDDISVLETRLRNYLYPEKTSLENEINDLVKRISDDKAKLAQIIDTRNQEAALFAQRMKDHDQAAQALAEAVNLVQSLSNSPSLLQINKAKTSVKSIEKNLKFNHATFAPLIQALVQLTLSQNFASQENVQKILGLLARVKSQLNESRQAYEDAENKAIAEFNLTKNALEQAIPSNENLLASKRVDLENNRIAIENNEKQLAKREEDRKNYRQDLENENASFKKLTEIHEALVKQIQGELAVVAEAAGILQSAYANAPEYLKDIANRA